MSTTQACDCLVATNFVVVVAAAAAAVAAAGLAFHIETGWTGWATGLRCP